jgi:hypothetical protein
VLGFVWVGKSSNRVTAHQSYIRALLFVVDGPADFDFCDEGREILRLDAPWGELIGIAAGLAVAATFWPALISGFDQG